MNPDEVLNEQWLRDPATDFPARLPEGVTKSTDWYANRKYLADGRIVTTWYRRGSGGGPQGVGDKEATTVHELDTQRHDDWLKLQAQPGIPIGSKTTKDAQGNVTKVTTNQRADGSTYDVTESASDQSVGQVEQSEGTPDPSKPGGIDNERPRMVTRDAAGNIIKAQPLDAGQDKAWREARERSRNPGQLTDEQMLARAPQVATGTANTTSPYVLTTDPATGAQTWTPNKNYHKPNPEPISTPSDQEYTTYRNDDGSLTSEKNKNYRPPSKLIEISPGVWKQLTEDENHKPVLRDVDNQTTIRPADLPVLQAKYGEIAQGLGNLLADLNRRVASGEITPQEKDTAFTQAHQQADTQVNEINSVLSNSRAAWAQDVTQQNSMFGEAASRRGFAQNMVQNAFTTGANLAASSGPGHGKEIAQGMAAMLDIGQKYAQGMGGFPSMDPVAAPLAVQQARAMGLPGFGAPGAPGAPGVPPPPPPQQAAAAAAEAERQRQLAQARQTEVNRPPAFSPPPPISGAPVGPGAPAPPFQPTPYPGLSPAAVQATTGTTGSLITGALGGPQGPQGGPPTSMGSPQAAPTSGSPGGSPLQTAIPPYQPPAGAPALAPDASGTAQNGLVERPGPPGAPGAAPALAPDASGTAQNGLVERPGPPGAPGAAPALAPDASGTAQNGLVERPGPPGAPWMQPYAAPWDPSALQTLPYTGQPTNPQTMPDTGGNPGMSLMSTMGSRFGTQMSPFGLPATVGGSGYFDLGQVAQGMLGDGSDPAWEEAVRQAHAAMTGGGTF